jgi:predicted porin
MQKKLIALAIAGLASSAAFAQSNVTAYGVIDYGYVNRSSSDGASTQNGTRSEFASGVASGSRLGFKGSEDLGNGLKAIFEIEYGITVDNGGNATNTTSVPTKTSTGGYVYQSGAPVASSNYQSTFWNRHSYVGLTGGFGTVLGGRVDGDRYSVINSYDPFGGGTVASAVTAFGGGQVTRGDNAIAYISPDLSGFTILAFYTTKLVGNEAANVGTGKQNDKDLRGGGLNVTYANGPIRATANYESFSQKSLGSSDVKVYEFAGSYDFGVVKISALYDDVKADRPASAAGADIFDITGTTVLIPGAAAVTALSNATDFRNFLIGASFPVGNGLIRAVFTKHDDRNADNAGYKKFGIGYKHNLSKRTYLYTDYARISNDSAGAGQIGYSGVAGAADYTQTAGVTSYGTRGFDLGINHSF